MSAPDASAAALLEPAARALERARAAGAPVAEAYVERASTLGVDARDGRIETLRHGGTLGLALRVIVNDAVGFATGTDLSAAGLDALARRAVALARFATPDPACGLPTPEEAGGEADADLELFDPATAELPGERLLELALALERAACAADPRVRRSDGARLTRGVRARALANSHGLARAWADTSVDARVVALADDAGRQQPGRFGARCRHVADLPPPEALGREAARRAAARIGARPVPSARVPVVMAADVAGAWIAELFASLTGAAVLRGATWLAGHAGEPVAPPHVTLVDDGALPRGPGSTPYDGEGVRTRRTVLVDAGRLAAFAYDHAHARRAGARSTANAVRDLEGPPAIGCHNLFVVPGASTPEQLVRSLARGFLFEDQGVFGFDPVTGDYSYQASGCWIERGERVWPVDGVTVAGRASEMLRGITAVANDLELRGPVASPALLVAELTLGGA